MDTPFNILRGEVSYLFYTIQTNRSLLIKEKLKHPESDDFDRGFIEGRLATFKAVELELQTILSNTLAYCSVEEKGE